MTTQRLAVRKVRTPVDGSPLWAIVSPVPIRRLGVQEDPKPGQPYVYAFLNWSGAVYAARYVLKNGWVSQ